MTNAVSSIEDARRFFSLIAQPGDVFELRGLARVNGSQHVTSGFFDDVSALAKAAIERSGKDDGVYATINPVNSALMFRSGRNKVRRAGNGDTTSDRDVVKRRHLLIDIDPIRPAGISSSEIEHAAAIEMAMRLRDDMAKHKWPEPILGDSGNGAHLIYGIDLPVEDDGLVKRTLARLSKLYSTSDIKIDEKVYNPARISKVYGTLTRKGIDAPERPHRLARILEAPSCATIAEVACR